MFNNTEISEAMNIHLGEIFKDLPEMPRFADQKPALQLVGERCGRPFRHGLRGFTYRHQGDRARHGLRDQGRADGVATVNTIEGSLIDGEQVRFRFG